jgi:predicted RND superfamily exporter protein
VVLGVLFFSFRHLTAVLLPLITVLIAVIWSIGAMPLFGVQLSILSTVLPVILVAVGSAYGIHVITHYMEDLDARDFPLSEAEHRELVFSLLRKIGKPVALAALTTLAGFISFCFTEVPPIREFGFFSSFGVAASFLTAVTMIPALLIIRGPKPMKIKAAAEGGDSLNEALTDTLLEIARKKRLVLLGAGMVTAFSFYGLSKLIVDNVYVEYFRKGADVRRSDYFIREKFGGSKVVNVVVEADNSEDLLMPEVLSAMDGLQTYLQNRVPGIGKVMGFTDLVKRTNQVFNADESPEGLRGTVNTYEDPDEEFGFGNFGFNGPADTGGFAEAAPDAGGSGTVLPRNGGAAAVDVALLERAVESPNMSAAALVQAAKKLVNYEGAAYYEIPVDPARYGKTEAAELSTLVSNYLVLISGSTGDYANDGLEPTAVRLTVQMRTTGDAGTKAAMARLYDYIDANFPDTVRVRVGGPALVDSSLSALVVESQIISVAVSVFMVFLIIALSNRS